MLIGWRCPTRAAGTRRWLAVRVRSRRLYPRRYSTAKHDTRGAGRDEGLDRSGISVRATGSARRLLRRSSLFLDDGLSYVKEGDKVFDNPAGHDGLAVVPEGMEDAVTEAAEECPGECIFME